MSQTNGSSNGFTLQNGKYVRDDGKAWTPESLQKTFQDMPKNQIPLSLTMSNAAGANARAIEFNEACRNVVISGSSRRPIPAIVYHGASFTVLAK